LPELHGDRHPRHDHPPGAGGDVLLCIHGAQMARPGLGVRGGVRPADRADADGADPIAADLLQYEPDRYVPVPVVVDRAHHLRPAAGDLPVAQLHVRGAHRPDRGGPDRRCWACERVCTHHAAADAACHRQLCDLPVPVGVERPAGGADVLRRVAHRATTDGGSGGPDRLPRAGLAPTPRRGVRVDPHPADRVLRLAALLRARAAGGLGEGVARRRLARPPPQPKVNRFTRYVLRRVVLPGIDSAQAVSNAREPPARTPPRPCACPPFPAPAPAAPLAPARRSPGPRPPAYRYWAVP